MRSSSLRFRSSSQKGKSKENNINFGHDAKKFTYPEERIHSQTPWKSSNIQPPIEGVRMTQCQHFLRTSSDPSRHHQLVSRHRYVQEENRPHPTHSRLAQLLCSHFKRLQKLLSRRVKPLEASQTEAAQDPYDEDV